MASLGSATQVVACPVTSLIRTQHDVSSEGFDERLTLCWGAWKAPLRGPRLAIQAWGVTR